MAEAAGKRMLLTGDGRGDHLIQGLGQAGLLTDTGTCHVELLKLPHHGSDRNVTRSFLETVTADIYVASANGKDGNPDLPTLIWIVETAKDRGAEIELVLTNQTPSSDELLATRDPSEFGYELTIMTETDVMTLVLDDDEP